MTKSLAGAMRSACLWRWALLVRMTLTVIVERLLVEALMNYYAGIARVFTRLLN